jgi:tetratricopeptide (TPR) repeat protein
MSWLTQIAARLGLHPGDRCAAKGMAAYRAKEFATAIDWLEKALDSAGGRYQEDYICTLLGNSYGECLRFDKAVAAHERALLINRDNHQAWANLGIAHRQRGDTQQAEKCQLRALKLKPDFVEAHINLGTLFVALEEPARAVESYERAVELDSSNAMAHGNLALVLAMSRHYREAEGRLAQAVELRFENAIIIRRRIDAIVDADEEYDPCDIGDWELSCSKCGCHALSHPDEDSSERAILCSDCGHPMDRHSPGSL